jgi:nucleoside-diphosphate kinase
VQGGHHHLQRGLVGEILKRFEWAGLKVAGMKMVWPSKELVGQHYQADEGYYKTVWEKAKKGAEERGEKFTETPKELGDRIREANMRYLSTGPVVALVLEGNTAIQTVRNIIGGTNPLSADIGTIRGDLTIDDFSQADSEGRAVRNLMHASSEPEEAEREIALWFTDEELYQYQTVMDKVLHDPHWGA